MPDRSVSYVFKGNFSNLTAGLAVASKNTKELGDKLTGLDKQGRQARSGLTTVADGAGKVGLAAAATFTVAISKAAKFDQAISQVRAATHETEGNMRLLEQAALDAGQATQYSAVEAADGIEQLAKAGVSTADILDGGLNGALNLAAAGTMEVGDAAEIAATAMTQFKLAGDQIPHLADLLAAGAGKAQGEVSDLGMALKQSGLVAAQTGLSIEETTGALAQFAANGLLGSDAGTSMKVMLQSLSPNSDRAASLMAKLGISAYDASGSFVGMEAFAGQLQAALGKLSDEQRNAALKTIFGSDAVRAAAIIYKDGAQGVAEWQDKVNDAGYAAETAALNTDNLIGDLERLGGALETAFIKSGEGSQGGLRSLVQGGEAAVDVFNGLPAPVQSSTTALLGLTAVIGGGAWFGAKAIQGVADTRQALADLETTGSKTGRVLWRVGRFAGGAAIGITAFSTAVALANEEDPTAGIEKNTKAILDFADGADDAKAQIDALFSRSSSSFSGPFKMKSQIEGLDDALKKLDTGSLEKLWSDPIFMDSDWDLARQSIERLDDAMSQLVTQGYIPEAAEMFDYFESRAVAVGYSTSEAADLLPQYGDALIGVENATRGATGAMKDFGVGSRKAGNASEKAALALREQRQEARDTAGAFLGLGDSLNDSKVSLSDWIRQMREQANALRNFRLNAETAANKGLRQGLIAALQEAGPEGAMRMKQLAGATRQEIAAANAAWASGRAEMQRWVDFKVPPKNINVVGGERAVGMVSAVKAALAELRDKTVTIWTVRRGAGLAKTADVADARPGSADGTTVPKTGMGYADRHPYLLADGEEVISNRYGQADRWRPLLKAINANRLADGGTAGKKKPKYPAPKSVTVRGANTDGIYQIESGRTLGSATSALDLMRGIVKGLTGDLKTLRGEYREAQKAIQRDTKSRDAIAEKVSAQQGEVDRLTGLFDGLSSTIQSGLAVDQFAMVPGSGNAWNDGGKERMPSFQEVLDRLDASTDNANAFTKATTTLTAKGLTRAALESVLSQGLGAASMLADLSPEDLAKYQASFDQNTVARGFAGAMGGQAVYGADKGRAEQILAANQAELARANTALAEANRAAAIAEKARDRAEKLLEGARDDRKTIQSQLADIRDVLDKRRQAAESGARSRRNK